MSRGSQGAPPTLDGVKHVAGRHWFGAYRSVVLCYWAQACTPDELGSLRPIYRAIAAETKSAVSVLHYIEQDAGLPAPNLRNDLIDKLDGNRVSLACVGVVLAGAGFWVSALSSFIVGVRMLMPKSAMPFRVTRDLVEMKPWLLSEYQRATGERIEMPLETWLEQARTAIL